MATFLAGGAAALAAHHRQHVIRFIDPQAGLATSAASIPVTIRFAHSAAARTVFLFANGRKVDGWVVPRGESAGRHTFTLDLAVLPQARIRLRAALRGRWKRLAVARVSIIADRTAPVTTDDAPVVSSDESVTVQLTGHDAPSGVARTCYRLDGAATSCTPFDPAQPTTQVPVAVSGDGTHTLRYYSVDAAGNREATHTARLQLDGVAPTTTADLTSGWYSATSKTVTLSAQDTGVSGLARTCYVLDGAAAVCGTSPVSIDVTGAGEHTLGFWSVDVAGNTESHHILTLGLDDTVPRTVSDVTSGWYSATSKTVTLTADDPAGSGVARTCYVLDAASPVCGQPPVVVDVTGQGAHTLQYWSVDVAGNTESHHSVSVDLDGSAPQTTVDNPANSGWYAGSSTTVSLTATDAGSGVAQICYSLDAAPQACTSRDPAQSSVDVSVPVSGTGSHTLTYHAVDAAGNVEAAHTFSFGLDNTAPTTTDDAPAGWISATSGTVDLTSTDAGSGVAQLCYSLDAAPQACTAPDPAQRSVVVPVPVVGTGTHTLTYHAVDTAGNVEPAHTTVLGLDATAPTTTDDAPAGWISAPSVTVNLTSSDAGSGVAQTCYVLDAASPVCGQPPVGVHVTGDGAHTLQYWSVDVAGNTEPHQSADVAIDDTGPYGQVNATWDVTGGQLDVGCQLSDALSGVDTSSVDVSVNGGSVAAGCTGVSYPVGAGFADDVEVTAADNAGNLTDIEVVLFDNGGSLGCTPITTGACGGMVTTP